MAYSRPIKPRRAKHVGPSTSARMLLSQHLLSHRCFGQQRTASTCRRHSHPSRATPTMATTPPITMPASQQHLPQPGPVQSPCVAACSACSCNSLQPSLALDECGRVSSSGLGSSAPVILASAWSLPACCSSGLSPKSRFGSLLYSP